MKWADYLDKMRLSQVDEVIILTKKLRLTPEYVTNMPAGERRHALKVVGQIADSEANANSRGNGKFEPNKKK